jgi:hypothetical protein
VLRLLSRCEGRCRGVKAAVKVSRPPSRRCRSFGAAIEVFKAAVELLRLLSRHEAAIEALSKC